MKGCSLGCSGMSHLALSYRAQSCHLQSPTVLPWGALFIYDPCMKVSVCFQTDGNSRTTTKDSRINGVAICSNILQHVRWCTRQPERSLHGLFSSHFRKRNFLRYDLCFIRPTSVIRKTKNFDFSAIADMTVNIEVITRLNMSLVAKNYEKTIDFVRNHMNRSSIYDII